MIGVFAVKQKLAFLINTSRDKYSKFRCVHEISSNSLTLKVKKKFFKSSLQSSTWTENGILTPERSDKNSPFLSDDIIKITFTN